MSRGSFPRLSAQAVPKRQQPIVILVADSDGVLVGRAWLRGRELTRRRMVAKLYVGVGESRQSLEGVAMIHLA